ncbi:hypothetical protein LF41_2377 [Lysobacter dokdonensis DS-58]|uniref:Uncharacterized protein n=1 Tax=Lysobacter dokdonensis DS-58 TaxID=1300345 RepID=A0A0A2WNK0_9GAMM|nr:hypothetical protein [Lysobacter dokdonensis]KGQ19870.1 hypothetical protein LF41_2377 [Lysobacter dokdonensis DS-58]
MSEKYSVMCPMCGAIDHLSAERVPDHIRQFVNEAGETVTEDWPAVIDYECRNCGTHFTMPENQEDFR